MDAFWTNIQKWINLNLLVKFTIVVFGSMEQLVGLQKLIDENKKLKSEIYTWIKMLSTTESLNKHLTLHMFENFIIISNNIQNISNPIYDKDVLNKIKCKLFDCIEPDFSSNKKIEEKLSNKMKNLENLFSGANVVFIKEEPKLMFGTKK